MTQRIALISALHEELSDVLALMPDEQAVPLAGRTYWQGHWQGKEIVAVLSGIGKVAAATTTTLLIERFQPDGVLFTGVAGGLGAAVKVGDIVVGDRFGQHDMDASPLFPRYEMPGYGRSTFDADPRLTEALEQACDVAVSALQQGQGLDTLQALGLGRPAIHRGKIITGDRFVSTSAESHALRQQWPLALAVDMESAAVAQVCHDHGVPFGAVRTVSDRADDSAHVDFPLFLDRVARHYSAHIVSETLRRL